VIGVTGAAQGWVGKVCRRGYEEGSQGRVEDNLEVRGRGWAKEQNKEKCVSD